MRCGFGVWNCDGHNNLTYTVCTEKLFCYLHTKDPKEDDLKLIIVKYMVHACLMKEEMGFRSFLCYFIYLFFILIDVLHFVELRKKHRLELEKLTLTAQPFRTLMFFFFATVQNLKNLLLYILRKGGWYKVLSILVVPFGLLLMAVDGSHEKVFISFFQS